MRPTLFFLAALALLSVPVTGSGQAPGYQQIDIGTLRAEYNAEVLDRINEVLYDWSLSWSTDDIDALVESYWPDAVLIPHDGSPLKGQTAIHEYFARVVPTHGQVEAFMLDFDASGGMATVYGNYMIQIQQGAQMGTMLSGPVVTVYMRRGRHWRIRTQVFRPAGS